MTEDDSIEPELGGCLLCRVVVDFAGISSIRNVVMKEEEKTENFCERPTKTISHITSPFAPDRRDESSADTKFVLLSIQEQ